MSFRESLSPWQGQKKEEKIFFQSSLGTAKVRERIDEQGYLPPCGQGRFGPNEKIFVVLARPDRRASRPMLPISGRLRVGSLMEVWLASWNKRTKSKKKKKGGKRNTSFLCYAS